MKTMLRVRRLPLFLMLLLLPLFHTACSGSGITGFILDVLIVGEGNVSDNSLGFSCDADCSDIFTEGTQITLTPSPAASFEFLGWSGGGCTGIGDCLLTLDADTQVTATFNFTRLLFVSRADQAGNVTEVDNIWSVNLDGTDAKPLSPMTDQDADSEDPAWSPDNSKILFSSSRALDGSDAPNTNDTINIWVMDADGSNPQPLTEITAVSADSDAPQWSPDGTKIIYHSLRALNGSDQASDTRNIWIMNADGSDPQALAPITAMGAHSYDPQFSPDGTQIVFESSRDLNGLDALNANSTRNIWIVNADGSNPVPLTELTAVSASSFDPQWSPDGTQIAFHSHRALNPGDDAANTNATRNIWVVNADGSGPKPLTMLTADMAGSSSPRYSPDGNWITYDSRAALDGSNAATVNDSGNIWLVSPDGSNRTPVTLYTVSDLEAYGPVFSAGGSKIAFSSSGAFDGSDAINNNATSNIFVINPDGSGATALTQNTDDKASSYEPQFNRAF